MHILALAIIAMRKNKKCMCISTLDFNTSLPNYKSLGMRVLRAKMAPKIGQEVEGTAWNMCGVLLLQTRENKTGSMGRI